MWIVFFMEYTFLCKPTEAYAPPPHPRKTFHGEDTTPESNQSQ